MKANEIRLYDLEAVNTTIVLREIQPNPDTICVTMWDLDAVNTTIVMHELTCAVASAVSYYGILKYWTGAIWERGLLKTWNGASFVTKTLKLWDGATWQEIDTTG